MTKDPHRILQDLRVGPGMPPHGIPRVFSRLYDLVYNQWWTWDASAYDLWARIDPRRWAHSHNPFSLIQFVEPETWEALSSSATFSELYHDVINRFDNYMEGADTWYVRNHADALDGPIAYLCAEYGLHHSLPFYSGGLGVLAGDHMKAASDLGLPIIGVGLFYRRGYFHQTVDPEGYQQHFYARLEVGRRPVRRLIGRSGHPLRVPVELPGRTVQVGAWKIDVGRVPLILLDTDLPENDPADRPITQILYVRGRQARLAQELILGVGGTRMLEEAGIEPAVWHVNEGHAAFSLIERLSGHLNDSLEQAKHAIKHNTLFTLHTPVPAGNEVFDLDLVKRYASSVFPSFDQDLLAELGRARPESAEQFDMGALAIKLSAKTNGVSKRHGQVVTKDWGHLIGGDAEAVTNGIHTPTWIGRNMVRVYERVIGSDWVDRLIEPEAWDALRKVPGESIWESHQSQKEVMLRNLRANLMNQAARHGRSTDHLRWIDDQLPSDRLTIVWARRMATYKRAGLIFSDPSRIRAILTNPERPVQIVFAGKAHPADREGQGLIKWIEEVAGAGDLAGHIFFIEDYDMALGASLVAGADVWMNTPRPPMEASGTSGMKAAANGVLNLSVLDGWWAEAFNGSNGWGFAEHSRSDAEDAGILYHLLESEVTPRFFDRDDDGVPHAWVEMMKEAMATVAPQFSTHRMLVDYAEKGYLPLGKKA
jgi:starch phosphorylase